MDEQLMELVVRRDTRFGGDAIAGGFQRLSRGGSHGCTGTGGSFLTAEMVGGGSRPYPSVSRCSDALRPPWGSWGLENFDMPS